jgi:hypothetical protein
MSHKSVVSLIEDVSKSLSDAVQFGYGRRSDFNNLRDKAEQIIWLLPLNATPIFNNNGNTETFQKTWNIILVFLAIDKTDSNHDDYKKILDSMDELLDKFIIRLNDYSMNSHDVVGAVTLRNFQQLNQIKGDADILTGWILSFQMTVSDDFNYCTPENVNLYAQS